RRGRLPPQARDPAPLRHSSCHPHRSRSCSADLRRGGAGGLIVLWEAADRICGKRLKAVLPDLVASLERHGHLNLDPAVRQRLLAASAATIDRLLVSVRGAASGRKKRKKATKPSQQVPVRTFVDWK